MIRKSQYIQLTLLILLIFVLFLMTATSISFQGDVVVSLSQEGAEQLAAATGPSVKSEGVSEDGEYIIIIQGDNTVGGKNIARQLECLKKEYRTYRTMNDVPLLVRDHMRQLILCSSKAEGYYSYEDIIEASMLGVDIIFAVLPAGEELVAGMA